MPALADKIMKRVRGYGRGWVFTSKHFMDLGARGSVDKALARLCNAGDVRRIDRGVYDYPRHDATFGTLAPDTDHLADALSVQTSERWAPSLAAAADSPVILPQTPVHAGEATSGRMRLTRTVVRGRTPRHRHAPSLNTARTSANAVVQALVNLRKEVVDSDTVQRVASLISEPDMEALLRARALMPRWMGDAILKIDAARHRSLSPLPRR